MFQKYDICVGELHKNEQYELEFPIARLVNSSQLEVRKQFDISHHVFLSFDDNPVTSIYKYKNNARMSGNTKFQSDIKQDWASSCILESIHLPVKSSSACDILLCCGKSL
ncbi:hypothetical protein CDAR_568171 [Caerostris darwini]|uniref:Uncharacterized protein n=1 Tax=Caerostris darwini TaxID=1538125 RepID=A0AAV4UTI5_9ARAC|nr:hypothetical protein CDAR_568171 [Caerostris darwini]